MKTNPLTENMDDFSSRIKCLIEQRNTKTVVWLIKIMMDDAWVFVCATHAYRTKNAESEC